MNKRLSIPIFNAVVWLVVSDNIPAARAEMAHWFGPVPECPDYDALCSYGAGHNFALFFEPGALTPKIIAHEIFHLTHRIIDWAGVRFDSQSHEAGALLNGYLSDLIYRELGMYDDSNAG